MEEWIQPGMQSKSDIHMSIFGRIGNALNTI